jgi:hypothetical protein
LGHPILGTPVKPGPSLAIEAGLRVLRIVLIGPSVRDEFLPGEPLPGERAHFLSDTGQQEACSDEGADGGNKEERRAPQ